MSNTIFVVKRNGEKESLDLEKLHRVLFWATEGITGVSVSDIEMKSSIQFYNGMKTSDIHQMMVKAAEDLVSIDSPNYQYVAARLALFDLRKRVLGQFDPIPLRDLVHRNIEAGMYDPKLLTYYTDDEWDRMDKFIRHDRDYNIAIAGMKQLMDKYLVQDRSTKKIFETPQYAFVLIAAVAFHRYDPSVRLHYVKQCYDAISRFKISLPTPIMAGVRTVMRQFSSCVLIDSDDSLDSITTAGGSILKYASQRAGIGINGGRIRALNSKVRNGEVVHTGVVPYFRKFESDLKCCSQGGIRDASACLYVPVWHLEIEDIIPLKNNKGTPDNRVRRLDYNIQWDTYLLKRVIAKQDLTLFSPSDVPGLYEAYFQSDRSEFERLYEMYEKNPTIRKKTISARELLIFMLNERQETGRIYTMMVDHCNTHSTFKKPIYMSNLCVEITLPTEPVNNAIDTTTGTVAFEGLIQLCTLGAINLGQVKSPDDVEPLMDILVRLLNELLDYQHYPVPQAERATKRYRPLGIGVINYAYFLAKHGVHVYEQEAYDLTHRYAEAMAYYGLKTTVELAKERGPIPGLADTKYADGILIIDTYKKAVDEITTEPLHYDWEALRKLVVQYGVYNATLLSLMPAESSAVVSNSTNGMELIRSLVTKKKNKKISMIQVAPEAIKLKNQYDLLWDLTPDLFEGYLRNAAVWQKFVCQSISTNTSYNPEHFENRKIPMEIILKHFLLTAKYGIKTLYYANTKDKEDEVEFTDEEGGCSDGACKI